ncbi:MAG: ATP-binding protein, partial [Clostridia bacterium]|nr:ATP-binding protein [Clostridia bacterium]
TTETAETTENAAAPGAKEEKPRKSLLGSTLFVPTVAAGLVIVLVFITLVFNNFIENYQSNSDIESASHLVEINQQIKLYMEEAIDNDWKNAYSMANCIVRGNFDDEQDLYAFIAQQRGIWGVSDIIVYTESGFAIGADGEIRANDQASELVYQATLNKEYMSIIDSAITYTVPAAADMQLQGSKIVAISVVRDVSSFLDNMNFSSFEGAAYVYLTQDNGVVVSSVTHADVAEVYNIMSLLEGRRVICLSKAEEHSLEHILTAEETLTHLMETPEGELYIVSAPVKGHQNDMRLFYIVPEAVVNRTLNRFSSYALWLSAIVITVFVFIALLIFTFIYKSRKRQFDKEIVARERMYDLLVRNTKTAFGLFAVNQDKPIYISPNAGAITGGRSLTIRKTEEGYSLKSDNEVETEAIRTINREMREWDGKSEFHSDYILNTLAPQSSYYAIQLNAIDEEGTEYVGVAQDVTQQYAREEMLKDALLMAERSNAAKSRFLSNMSHDIRTPMNAIVNMTNFAIDSMENPAKQWEYLQTIRESSDHLLKLINDVLDMSRIESGQAVIESEPFDIGTELNKLCDIVRPLCAAKQQTFLADFGGVHTTRVLGDQTKFSQIFMNLLSNAIKFTPERGAVRFIAIELPSLRADIVNIRLTVEDTGIGISQESLKHIFEPFSRAMDRRVNGIEGTGLGLSICKSYVAAMDGSIACESEEGSGTVFTVELFFHKARTALTVPVEAAVWGETPFLGKRCLLCEDNEVNRVIARTILEKLGFMVEIACDGREGENAFLQSAPGYFDIIYMDIQMPVMDGYQAADAIRESAHPQAGTIPIIAMTANVFAEDIEKARVAGMTGHIGKPIITLDLIGETYNALEHAGGKTI